jgi:integrase
MAKRKLVARLNLLTVREVLNATEGELSDGGGLLLRITGSYAAWVFRYTAPSSRRREMGLGSCDRQSAKAAGASLSQARELAGKAREMLASQPPRDPIDERDKAKAAAKEAEAQRKAAKRNVFATLAQVARSYHETVIEPARKPKFSSNWINSLENHVPAGLWQKPIAEITRVELLDFLRQIQNQMADTAQKVRQRLDEVFDDAFERGMVPVNLVAMLRTKLRKENRPRRSIPFPSMPFLELPGFMTTLRERPGISARCLEFTILTTARTGESVGATWREFNLEAATWTIPGKRMKGGETHIVYLSARALAIVLEMQKIGSPWVFPSTNDLKKPMSNMGMLTLLKRMKRTDITVHGFRATFSTWANETASARPDVIEACLAHREGDKIRAAYNRAQFSAERRKLLENWAEYVDGRQPVANVFELGTLKAA